MSHGIELGKELLQPELATLSGDSGNKNAVNIRFLK